MPLIKLISSDLKTFKLVSATNLKTIFDKGEQKLGYKIEKLLREEDKFEIDDDEVLGELLTESKELSVIAVGSNKTQKMGFKVSTTSSGFPKFIEADTLDSLKQKCEKEFGIKIEAFVRKLDGCEVDDDEVLQELMDEDDKWLIAKEYMENNTAQSYVERKPVSNASVIQNDDPEFLNAEINRLNELLKKSNTQPKTGIRTAEVDREFENMKKEIEKMEKEKERKLEKLNEIKTMTTTLKQNKEEIKMLEKEYQEKLFRDEATREASKTEVNKLQARILELELKKKRISGIFNDLKEAEKVDICFLVDATGSMSSYINEAKSVMHRIINKLRKRFKDFELRVAFVGYRDHCDGSNRITKFPFSENIDSFKLFVSSVNATGGGDCCEDVFGGLEEIINLDWSNMSRILFHIADAPCHGRRFHLGAGDDYPEGDPRGLKIEDLLKGVSDKNISYYFAEITDKTVKMIDEFNIVLSSTNGNKVNVVKLEAVEGLTEVVTTSIVKTITMSKSLSMHSMTSKKMRLIPIDASYMTWSADKMDFYKVDCYHATFTGDITNIRNKSINLNKINLSLYLAKKPFAKGALRYAYTALLDKEKRSVMKQSASIDPEYNTMKFYTEMIETQVVAGLLADKFFKMISLDKTFKFLPVNLIHIVDKGEYYSIEDYIPGEFVKWMNNVGVLDEDIYSSTLDAFSHWTYQVTDEYLIVTDLQGFKVNDKEFILTDPAISSPEGHDRFSTTNLALKGIKKFFETHQCNHICEHLKLKRHAYQKLPDRKPKSMTTKIF